MAKKRYVGLKYEAPDEIEPEFDAKGIETIRRDGIPAGQKMVEICLKSGKLNYWGSTLHLIYSAQDPFPQPGP
jgi:hypothetical protein